MPASSSTAVSSSHALASVLVLGVLRLAGVAFCPYRLILSGDCCRYGGSSSRV